MTGRPTPNQRCAVEVVLDSSLDLQRLPRARINNSHTTFGYHIPYHSKKNQKTTKYQYHTSKCTTLHHLDPHAAFNRMNDRVRLHTVFNSHVRL